MENWRDYLNEQSLLSERNWEKEAAKLSGEAGAGDEKEGRYFSSVAAKKQALGKVGEFVATQFGKMDAKAKDLYCTKKFPEELAGQKDIKTYGDLVALLRCTIEYEKGKKVLNYLIGFIPEIGLAQKIFNQSKSVNDFLLKMYQLPDEERPAGNLGKLDMDDKVAAIIDNEIEKLFLKNLIQMLQQADNLDDDIPEDWQITHALKKFLEDREGGGGRTITGFEKEE